jgi:hypothetical protein
MSTYTREFGAFDAESYFVRRLKDLGREIFAGVSDPNIRRERIREAIIAGKLDCTILGCNSVGKSENFQTAFERLYNTPLHVKAKTKEPSCT